MAELVNGLRIRKRLGRDKWRAPNMFGPDGFYYLPMDPGTGKVIVTGMDRDGMGWIHASISRPVLPSYDDLVMLHSAIWGADGYSYQVFAPADKHVNIHERTLHLWGLADGSPVLPDFAEFGTI